MPSRWPGQRDGKNNLDRQLQFQQMLQLKEFYKIQGPVESYLIRGVGPARSFWYKLALAIASDLEVSFKIVAPRSGRKTAPRWRGEEGKKLVELVDRMQAFNPKRKRTDRWCLQKIQISSPEGYGGMKLDDFATRFAEARKHHNITKPRPLT